MEKKLISNRATKTLVIIGLMMVQTGVALRGADVSLYLVKKGILYTQADAGWPTADATNGYAFQANVYEAVPNSVTNDLVVTNFCIEGPGPVYYRDLPYYDSYEHRWETYASLDSLTKFDLQFPDGTYRFTIQTVHDGTVAASLDLFGDAYPGPPHISNSTDLQAVNPGGYSSVRWEGFTGGSATDFIRLAIKDAAGNQIYQTPNVENEGALDGTATAALIGPGILATGQTYRATLIFQKNVEIDRATYPGALGVAGYYAETTFDLVTENVPAPDVKVYELEKGTRWVQSGTSPPSPEAPKQCEFIASVKAYVTGILTDGTLQVPGTNAPASRVLGLQSDLTTLKYSGVATNAALLDALYGAGTYVFDFNTVHDGAKSLTPSIESITNAPIAPQLENLPAFQTVKAALPLPVCWRPWTDGTPKDYIEFRIEDHQGNKIFDTATPGHPKILNGLATNTVVPAGTLVPGTSYRALLYFRRIATMDITTYPAVLGLMDYYSRTRFDIVTRPSLSASWNPTNQTFQVAASVVPGQSCRLDVTTNLPPQWVPLSTNTATGHILIFKVPVSTDTPRSFYRVVIMP
jgi:hypothetical protein